MHPSYTCMSESVSVSMHTYLHNLLLNTGHVTFHAHIYVSGLRNKISVSVSVFLIQAMSPPMHTSITYLLIQAMSPHKQELCTHTWEEQS